MSEEKQQDFPVLYKRKEDCCGCSACFAVCPRDAISMEEDEEGYEYPGIDRNKCVKCFMCVKVCPVKEAKNSL